MYWFFYEYIDTSSFENVNYIESWLVDYERTVYD
jgi:hypothetical protein